MYYSVLIEIPDENKKSDENIHITLVDQTDTNKIKSEILTPYLNAEDFLVDGYCLSKSKILRIKIVASEQSIKSIVKLRNQQFDEKNRNSPVFLVGFSYNVTDIIKKDTLVTDVTNKIFSEVKESDNSNAVPKRKHSDKIKNKRVFIVHGHDDKIKLDVARFLEKLGFEAVILHEQSNQGMTIIEKIEKNTEVGYGIILYTPCDKGGTTNTPYRDMKFRARQNVIFEHGYLIGKLGRKRVCALVDGDIERPSDIDGILYISYQTNWQIAICKELKNLGYDVDLTNYLK